MTCLVLLRVALYLLPLSVPCGVKCYLSYVVFGVVDARVESGVVGIFGLQRF